MDALRQYGGLFGELSLMKLADVAFWIAVFLLLLIVVFENIGLITAQTQMIGRPERFKGVCVHYPLVQCWQAYSEVALRLLQPRLQPELLQAVAQV